MKFIYSLTYLLLLSACGLHTDQPPNQFNESPHLEQLASEGMLFTNAYAAGPVCSPTRASIMSGQYPARVGVIYYIPGH